MPFDIDERSIYGSTPVELYTFVTPSTTYRLTTYHKDVTVGGNTFTATPGSRSSLQITDLPADQFEASVELPASHALCQTYANGVPPREVLVTIERHQLTSAASLTLWQGYVGGLTFRGRPPMGSFRVPSLTGEAITLQVPSVRASRLCNHVLYDGRCGKLRADFDLATTIAVVSADGKTITTAGSVPAAVGAVPWARHGELVHAPSGERRTIVSQPALNKFLIDLEFPSGSLSVGDAVTIYAGCDLTPEQCRDKFANVINFGGHPELPSSNPWYYGVVAAKGRS